MTRSFVVWSYLGIAPNNKRSCHSMIWSGDQTRPVLWHESCHFWSDCSSHHHTSTAVEVTFKAFPPSKPTSSYESESFRRSLPPLPTSTYNSALPSSILLYYTYLLLHTYLDSRQHSKCRCCIATKAFWVSLARGLLLIVSPFLNIIVVNRILSSPFSDPILFYNIIIILLLYLLPTCYVFEYSLFSYSFFMLAKSKMEI